MYIAIPTQKSCARAWVAAAMEIMKHNDEGYNVIVDVENPVSFDSTDNEIISEVDDFLRKYDCYPISTVCNTIFPQSLYNQHGAPVFYEKYHEAFDRLTKTRRWGRYFERMTRHQTRLGKTYNPLEQLIGKLQERENGGQKFKSAYELAVYDPLEDGRSRWGGQCLSFLSFKCHPNKGLMLTAMYRNHTYISRCLGNLIGLGQLQAFVAERAGLTVGSLTCVSTHAEIDKGPARIKDSKQFPWGVRNARDLITRSNKILCKSVTSTVSEPIHDDF